MHWRNGYVREVLLADVALKEALLLVIAHVRGQRSLVREGHAALGALERLEAHMCALVRRQAALVAAMT
jgi:hypothetical protein